MDHPTLPIGFQTGHRMVQVPVCARLLRNAIISGVFAGYLNVPSGSHVTRVPAARRSWKRHETGASFHPQNPFLKETTRGKPWGELNTAEGAFAFGSVFLFKARWC